MRGRLIPGPDIPKHHECGPPRYTWRGPRNGTLWQCPCGNWWVWTAHYPGSLTSVVGGRAKWWNVAYQRARQEYFDRGGRTPDDRDFGGRGPSELPWCGSPADGESLEDAGVDVVAITGSTW